MRDEFDVIVLGAGSAGISAAAELTLRGVRTLLIAESKEVAYHFRSPRVGDYDVPTMYPARNLHGEGGYWLGLARAYNIPLRYIPAYVAYCSTVEGSGKFTDIPVCPTASGLTNLVESMAPVPLGAGRADLERVMEAAMAIPRDRLNAMREKPLMEWLDEQGADEITTAIFLALGCNLTYLDTTMAAEHLSVFGGVGVIRDFVGGHATAYSIEPDARLGLWIPLARAVERRGCTVWRDSRVAEITVTNGRATGVALTDGREAAAPILASTFGTRRLAAVLDELPDEVARVAAYEEQVGGLSEFTLFGVSEKAVDRLPYRFIVTVGEDGSFVQIDWNPVTMAPWCAPHGTVIVASEVVAPEAEVEAMGGEAVLHERMRRRAEANYPGYNDSIVAAAALKHPTFTTGWCIGPKLPQRSTAVAGLWHVGENSAVVDGFFVEGSTSAGVLGARAIAGVQD